MGTQDQPTTKLVQALEALNDNRLNDMLTKAKEGFYTTNTRTLFPQTFLLLDLLHLGYRELAVRVANGEFEISYKDVNK